MNFEIKKLTELYRNEAAHCIAKTFSAREAMSQVMNLDYEEMLTFSKAIVDLAINEALSFVAIDTENNKLAAAIISEDFKKEGEPEGFEEVSPKFGPILQLLEELSSKIPQPSARGEIIHFFMVGVLEEYANHKIAEKLAKHAMVYAQGLGYKQAVSEATGKISQHIAKTKFHLNECASIDYKDFEYQGHKVFAGIDQELAEKCVLLQTPL